MTLLSRVRSFVRAIIFRRRLEREIEADLQFHIAERADDLVSRGLTRTEAERRAREELGEPIRWKEEGREAFGLRMLDDLRGDAVYALRWLRRSPAFAAAAVLSVALGVGANAAVFNLLNVVLLRSLPVADPRQLVVFGMSSAGDANPGTFFSYRMFQTFREQSRTLTGTTASSGIRFSVQLDQQDDPAVTGQMVSGNYYAILGVPMALGRPILPADDAVPGSGAVAVLSYGYWQRRFGGDAHAIGRRIALNGVPCTIVGVSAPEFFGTHVGDAVDVTVPLSMQPQVMSEQGGRIQGNGVFDFWLELIGRLAPGVSGAQAGAEVDGIFQRSLADEMLRQAGPKAALLGHPRIVLEPGGRGLSELRRRFARPLSVLMGAAALVLLIACANVANLLLARAAARRREIAVRVSLGASRARLVRQLLTESLLLALIGGAAGLIVAVWSSRTLAALLVEGSAGALAARPDGIVLTFTFAVTIATGLLFGIAPAFGSSQMDANAALKDGSASVTATGRRLGMGGALVAAQVAISVVLLVFAALFVRTLVNLRTLDLGLDQEHVLTLRLQPPGSNQKRLNEARLRRVYGSLLERVRAVPGVRAASLAGSTPLAGDTLNPAIAVAGYVPRAGEDMHVRLMQIYPDYFASLGVPLLAGREFTAADDSPRAPRLAVINETMARRFFGGSAAAIGRRFGLVLNGWDFQIAGVARDSRERALRDEVPPLAYATFAHTPTGRGQMTLVVRATADPRGLAATVRQLAREVEPAMVMLPVETLADRVQDATRQERLVALLSSLFGTVALTLAALGLYGVLAYAVARRRTEFGIRIALGETPGRLERAVLGESLLVAGAGMLAGIVAAFAVVRLVNRMLFGLAPLDPVSFGAAAALMLAVAAAAAWLPARHAARVDPIVALRRD